MQENIEELLSQGHFSDPHHILGLQNTAEEKQVIRLWRPGAATCPLEVCGEQVEAKCIHDAGLYEYVVPSTIAPLDYKIFHPCGKCLHDPYSFSPPLGELDIHLFGKGLHYELYDHLGATLKNHEGVEGIHFALWAPNARSVALVGDFNHWNSQVNPMRSIDSGIWEIFVPGLTAGEKYKFEVLTKEGNRIIKADPIAYFSEMRPKTASVVVDVERFDWSDSDWIQKRGRFRVGNTPLNIYEVHLGSWKKEEGGFSNYRTLAKQLAEYCIEMGYTHVELMGICEHPLDESWGYQVTGYFAPTSRYGNVEDFQYLVNELHAHQIGVILDWVPAHFPKDSHSLAQFDGTYLYEHQDSRQGYHPHWNTHIFNYGRYEVSNFLIASALFWFEKMHIDGIRVDAVASMIYLDYGREPGEWVPNYKGENINLEAVEFIKHMNSIIHEHFPDVLMIAEESTAFEGVTKAVEEKGLGFDLKWNLGWMNDCLSFFRKEFSERSQEIERLRFTMHYACFEKYLLVLSHDEVVHGKKSLLKKMPGTLEQQFSGVRLFLSMMMSMPGKKLTFMGDEIGQDSEWNCKEELPWDLLKQEKNAKLQKMVASLNQLYKNAPALFQQDFEPSSFEWVDEEFPSKLAIGYLRKTKTQKILCLHNFSLDPVENVPFPKGISKLSELFNSDREEWGGSGRIDIQSAGGITLPPLATLLFEVE